MPIKKIGDFPTNARIKIRYPEDNSEPTIDFEYPDNQRQLDGLWNTSTNFLLAIICTMITLLIFFSYLSLRPVNYPDCIIRPMGDSSYDVTVDNATYTIITNVSTIIAACGHEGGGWFIEWRNAPYPGNNPFIGQWSPRRAESEYYTFIWVLIYLVAVYAMLMGYAKLISLIVRKTSLGKSVFPGLNKKIRDKHFSARFTSADVSDDKLEIELPLFSNIYLDYEASGELSDYLKEVEIKEHDLVVYKRKRFKSKSEPKQEIPNVYLWKAVFKFSKKPTNGELKVDFT